MAASGSIVILPPGKYTVESRSRAIDLEGMVAPEEERGRRDVHAHAQPSRRAGAPPRRRRRSRWSRGRRWRRRARGRQGSPCGAWTGGTAGKSSPSGKELEGEPAQEVVLRPGERADAREQLLRRESGLGGRLVQRPPLERHLVRLEEERIELRGDLGGHGARGERGRPGVHLLLLAALPFQPGQRGLQVLLGRGLVAALSPPVEVHRARVQGERHRRGLQGRGRVAVVVLREVGEAELVGAAHLPQEARVDAVGPRLGLGDEGGKRLAVEAQQHRVRLHLRALAVRGLHLERRAHLRQDRADAERAVLLEENLLHGAAFGCGAGPSSRAHATMSGTNSGKLESEWSPPCTTDWQAPA